MAGRKPLTLTDSDYFELLRHIRQLPFKGSPQNSEKIVR